MSAAFKTYNGWRTDAKLRTSTFMRDETDEGRFTDEDNTEEIHRTYFKILSAAAIELDIAPPTTPTKPQQPTQAMIP